MFERACALAPRDEFGRRDRVVGEAAAPWRTHSTNHDCMTPESASSSRAGLEETLSIATTAGLIGVITHMKAPDYAVSRGSRPHSVCREPTTRVPAAA